MEGNKKDLASLMSTIGLKSKVEKGAFLGMYSDIFMLHRDRPTSESDSPISDFRNVYRRQVCRGGGKAYLPVQHLEKAKEDADAHFATCLADYISRLPDNSKQEEEEALLRQQKKTEEGWIVKANCWRADKFFTAITADAVGDFGRELRRKFPLDNNMKFYVDFEIRQYVEALMPNILNTFEEQVPVDEEKVRVEERCAELLRQCTQVEVEILGKNNSNREVWRIESKPAASHTERESEGNKSHANPSTGSRSLPSSIWMKGDEDKMAFPKHTTLPTAVLKCENSTTLDSQKSGALSIYEGQYPNAAVSKLLGVFAVDDVPPAPKGGQALDFRMHVDKFGMVHGKLAVRSTGKSISASFKTSAWCGNDEGNSQQSVAAGTSNKRILRGHMQDSTGSNKKLKAGAGQ